MPGILEKTHPFCRTNAIIRWDCESSIDTIVYYNGRTMQRNFIDWNEGQGYQLLIGQNELADALVTLVYQTISKALDFEHPLGSLFG